MRVGIVDCCAGAAFGPCCTDFGAIYLSGMVYEDVEKLYAEVRTDVEALIDNAMRVLYPGSLSPSSVASAATSGPLTIFAHNTTPFAQRDIVRMPLTSGGISSGDVFGRLPFGPNRKPKSPSSKTALRFRCVASRCLILRDDPCVFRPHRRSR